MRILKRLLKLLFVIIALVVGYKAVYASKIDDFSGFMDCAAILLIMYLIYIVYPLIKKWKN